MTDILAIVSKAVFEKDARVGGNVVNVGDVWPVDRYNANAKALAPLAKGGRIFLVTVRPPDEKLWLVGIVDQPKLKGSSWISATKNTTPVTNITSLRKTIAFESGKGMSQDKGALGMSLQTPRALAASDVTQILGLVSSSPAAASATSATSATATGAPVSRDAAALLIELERAPDDEPLRERVARELVAMGEVGGARRALQGIAHLNAHDETDLPCLCKRCWETAPKTAEHGGVAFARDLVVRSSRVLFFWAPAELLKNPSALRNSVRASLARRITDLTKRRKRQPRPAF